MDFNRVLHSNGGRDKSPHCVVDLLTVDILAKVIKKLGSSRRCSNRGLRPYLSFKRRVRDAARISIRLFRDISILLWSAWL